MATKKIICALHEKNTSQTGLFGIGQDSLIFAGESPSATLEIWSKIVHCATCTCTVLKHHFCYCI